jgi:hypothetical protein
MRIAFMLAVTLVTVAFCQPETFRSLSTSGMIQDDLDLWYSGILHLQPVAERLLEVRGVRIYSGLSNLSTGSDRIFSESDSTRGGFLIGGSWSPEESVWGAGLLTEFMDDRIYDDVSIPGPGGAPYLTGEGSIEGTWSEFVDTNGDGTLDSRHTVHESTEGRTDSTMTSAGLYGAYGMSASLRLGLGISWEKMETETLDPGENGSIAMTDSNLVTGVETYDMSSARQGTQTENRSGIVISASGTGTLTDVIDLGAMFQFASLSSELGVDQEVHGSEDFLPDQTGIYDLTTWSGEETFKVSPSGSRFGGGINLRYNLGEDWILESSGGYYTTSLSGSADEYRVSMDSSYIVTMGSFIDSTIIAMDGSGSTDVDLGDDLLALGAKLTFDPLESMVISMGAGFFMHDLTNTVTYGSQNTVVETYSDGDGQFADPDDYVSTSIWSQREEEKTSTSTTRVSLPVGLEFQLLPQLSARLGANPSFVWEKNVETTSLLEASPVVTHTVYGDGTEQQTVETPYQTNDGTRIETDEFYTDIPFSYGVGFTPNEHMKIDLMGLGESFQQWRLSATLLF